MALLFSRIGLFIGAATGMAALGPRRGGTDLRPALLLRRGFCCKSFLLLGLGRNWVRFAHLGRGGIGG